MNHNSLPLFSNVATKEAGLFVSEDFKNIISIIRIIIA